MQFLFDDEYNAVTRATEPRIVKIFISGRMHLNIVIGFRRIFYGLDFGSTYRLLRICVNLDCQNAVFDFPYYHYIYLHDYSLLS